MASSSFSDEIKAKRLLDAAGSGNLRLFKEIVKDLNEGNGIADKLKGIKDKEGDNAFHFAAARGSTAICQYFLEDLAFPVDFYSDKGETPLLYAAKGGHAGTMRYLISHGANPIVSDKTGLTPLHCAAIDGQPDLVKFLLSFGVPVDISFNYVTGTPLYVAAKHGQPSTVEVLLEHHADVNGATGIGFTPLFMSVLGGFLECTKLLIKAGANVNLKCPLGMAIQQELIEIIECLLEAGADPNVRNEYGWLPVEMAVMVKRKDILEMLFPLTSPVPEVQHWSVQGICQYVNSNAFQKKIVENFRKDLAEVKVKAADFFKKKEYLAANLFYSKAIELDKTIGSGDAVLFSNRSLCCHRMGDGDQALKDALVARRLRPEWPKAFYRMGAALMLLKEYGQASQAFMDGLQLDPTNIEMQKAHREAVDCLRKSDLGEDSE
ncbi:ankyrin repeat family protein [Rhynchospora pubera]|uniref:Ankyrin repeat family protein n=1 Tax=Rhynchospora pubera TaxID=906938 RepID=A0AAV8ERU4_9POAL|nr:ankyrin repeat family protein [Rhynchospora pubera]